MEVNMMKDGLEFDLQFFAEEVETEDTEENVEKEENKTEKEVKEDKKDQEKKYTDEQVDDIINKKFAKWKKDQEAKITEAEKLAKMNAEEKAEYERAKLENELEELRRKDTLNSMTKIARSMLSEKGIQVDDDLVGVLITTDADKTKEAVESFSKLFESTVEKAVNDKLKGRTPKVTNGKQRLTKEEILKEKDVNKRRRMMAENLELFS